MPYGTVSLKNAVFYAHHGVLQEEHRVGGRYEVDVIMELNFENAARTDSLEQTVDYEQVYERIRQIITENKFYLIERLAYLIAQAVMEDEPLLSTVEVAVRKANPPVGGPCDCAEAVYREVRNGGE